MIANLSDSAMSPVPSLGPSQGDNLSVGWMNNELRRHWKEIPHGAPIFHHTHTPLQTPCRFSHLFISPDRWASTLGLHAPMIERSLLPCLSILLSKTFFFLLRPLWIEVFLLADSIHWAWFHSPELYRVSLAPVPEESPSVTYYTIWNVSGIKLSTSLTLSHFTL